MTETGSRSLSAAGFSKRFGGFTALDDAGFSVAPGEIVALIGPNGSGKTTLLESVAGLLDADAGVVTDGSHTLARHERSRSIFYLPDGVRPWPDQRVDWVLRLVEGLFGSSMPRSAAIARLSLAPFLGARMSSLSKGEHRRVMIAIALLTPQPTLLLDEPFDGLDLRQTRDVMALLREQADIGRGLCLSIHQLDDAARVADRLVLLNNGSVVGAGTLDELRLVTSLPAAPLEEIFLALT